MIGTLSGLLTDWSLKLIKRSRMKLICLALFGLALSRVAMVILKNIKIGILLLMVLIVNSKQLLLNFMELKKTPEDD